MNNNRRHHLSPFRNVGHCNSIAVCDKARTRDLIGHHSRFRHANSVLVAVAGKMGVDSVLGQAEARRCAEVVLQTVHFMRGGSDDR